MNGILLKEYISLIIKEKVKDKVLNQPHLYEPNHIKAATSTNRDIITSYVSERNFITFTDVPKLGIKPISYFGTPLGIYCYPFNENIYQQMNTYNLPFAGDRRYVAVFTPKSWDGILIRNSDGSIINGNIVIQAAINITKNEMPGDVVNKDNIAELIDEEYGSIISSKMLGNSIEEKCLFYVWYKINNTKGFKSYESGRNKINFDEPRIKSQYKNLIDQGLIDSQHDFKRFIASFNFRKSLVEFGINGVVDLSYNSYKALIHSNEPTQAVFFNGANLQELIILNNPVYKQSNRDKTDDLLKILPSSEVGKIIYDLIRKKQFEEIIKYVNNNPDELYHYYDKSLNGSLIQTIKYILQNFNKNNENYILFLVNILSLSNDILKLPLREKLPIIIKITPNQLSLPYKYISLVIENLDYFTENELNQLKSNINIFKQNPKNQSMFSEFDDLNYKIDRKLQKFNKNLNAVDITTYDYNIVRTLINRKDYRSLINFINQLILDENRFKKLGKSIKTTIGYYAPVALIILKNSKLSLEQKIVLIDSITSPAGFKQVVSEYQNIFQKLMSDKSKITPKIKEIFNNTTLTYYPKLMKSLNVYDSTEVDELVKVLTDNDQDNNTLIPDDIDLDIKPSKFAGSIVEF